jgi:LacI family transcriptional regulator
MKITIRDIAKLANVSPAAVSFALNGKPGISDQTRKRILDIVAQTNYKSSSDKFSSCSANIALLFRNNIPPLDRLFYSELNSNFIQACEKLPYNFLVASTFFEDNKSAFSDCLRSADLDAIVAYGDISRDILPELNSLNIPILVLDSSRKEDNMLAVRVDYAAAAYTATQHLLDLGHKDIAYIGNDSLQDFNYLTFSGFQKATTEKGITLGMNRIQISVHDEESLIGCIEQALSGSKPPTALFCATDVYAIHAIRYLHTRGMHVPNDISVVGVDDISVSRFIIPSLTTVSIDREAMAQLGVELLQKIVNMEECSSVTLPRCDLVVRESTAPLKTF